MEVLRYSRFASVVIHIVLLLIFHCTNVGAFFNAPPQALFGRVSHSPSSRTLFKVNAMRKITASVTYMASISDTRDARYQKWARKSAMGIVSAFLAVNPITIDNAAAVDVDMIKSSGNVREGIAQSASKIPGFGPTDVKYPVSFAGKWAVDQKVTSVTLNEKISPQKYPRIVQRLQDLPSFEYERTYSNYDGNIVLDRGASTSSLYKTILGDKYARANWAFDNPNILSVETSDNMILEERVTKRSQESSSSVKEISQSYSMEDSTMVGYSEYSRLSEESASDADRNSVIRQPKVSGVRLLARYKFDNKGLNQQGQINEILGLERYYVYPSNSLDLGNGKPDVVVKSQVRMTRLPLE